MCKKSKVSRDESNCDFPKRNVDESGREKDRIGRDDSEARKSNTNNKEPIRLIPYAGTKVALCPFI